MEHKVHYIWFEVLTSVSMKTATFKVHFVFLIQTDSCLILSQFQPLRTRIHYLRIILLISYSHLRLGLPNSPLSSDLQNKGNALKALSFYIHPNRRKNLGSRLQ
jgi:hypothetical protein